MFRRLSKKNKDRSFSVPMVIEKSNKTLQTNCDIKFEKLSEF